MEERSSREAEVEKIWLLVVAALAPPDVLILLLFSVLEA